MPTTKWSEIKRKKGVKICGHTDSRSCDLLCRLQEIEKRITDLEEKENDRDKIPSRNGEDVK